jgi:hypothetical protein
MFSVDRATSRTLPIFIISVLELFLEMLLTFVTGIKALLLIVAACYFASPVTLPARTVAVAYGGRA